LYAALKTRNSFRSRRLVTAFNTARESRQSQAVFICVVCGYEANADINGARNILAAGHAVLTCGGTVQSDRLLKQEPGNERSVVTH
jgi:putative transposase